MRRGIAGIAGLIGVVGLAGCIDTVGATIGNTDDNGNGIGAAVVADTQTGERSISIGGTFGVGVSGSRLSRN